MDFTVSPSGVLFILLFLLKLDCVKVQASLTLLRELKQWKLSYLTNFPNLRFQRQREHLTVT